MKKNTFLIMVTLWFLLTSCGWNIKKENTEVHVWANIVQEKAKPDITESKDIIDFSGLIQSAWPTREFELKEENGFQLLTNNGSFNLSYYLTWDRDLNEYWGKCVEVKGIIPEDGEKRISNNDADWVWGSAVLEVQNIRVADNIICEQLKSGSTSPNIEEMPIELLDGYIIRNQRPAPDYSYDYALELITPENYFFIPEWKLPLIINMELFTLNNYIENKVAVRLTGYFDNWYNNANIFVSTAWETIQE